MCVCRTKKNIHCMYTINNNPWKSGGKFLFIFICIFLLLMALSALVGCRTNSYKYKICKAHCVDHRDDSDMVEYKRLSGVSCVWYTDTFQIKSDTLVYYNSDSSVVVVSPPYTVIRRK